MADRKMAVFGIYRDRTSVDNAVEALKAAEFRNSDISVLFPENSGTKDFAHEKNTKAPEGASKGAGTGALLGGGLGWLVGIGALAIPGLGPFIAAGPIMAALAGAGVGGTLGGITGALIGMGIPEYEAKRYEGRVKEGGILLSVHSDNSEWTKKAKQILERTSAENVSSTGESTSGTTQDDDETRDNESFPPRAELGREPVSQANVPAEITSDAFPSRDAGSQKMQLLSEELDVRKETVGKGEVRPRKEAVIETKNVQVPVTREELVIERQPPSQSQTTAAIGDESEIRIPVTEERVQVEKRPVVREEVVVKKQTVEGTQNISDELRHEELRVDDASHTGSSSQDAGIERKKSA